MEVNYRNVKETEKKCNRRSVCQHQSNVSHSCSAGEVNKKWPTSARQDCNGIWILICFGMSLTSFILRAPCSSSLLIICISLYMLLKHLTKLPETSAIPLLILLSVNWWVKLISLKNLQEIHKAFPKAEEPPKMLSKLWFKSCPNYSSAFFFFCYLSYLSFLSLSKSTT